MTASQLGPPGLWGSLGSAVLASSLDAVVVIDSDGAVVEWNPAAETMFGYSRVEALGRPLAELIIPPELRGRHRTGMARHLATGATTIMGAHHELEAVRADGSRFPVELTVTRVQAAAEHARGPARSGEAAPVSPVLFAGQIRDLSAHRGLRSALSTSEHHLSTVIDTAPMVLLSIDASGVVRLARGRGVADLGRDSGDVVGQDVQRSWAVEPDVREHVQRALRGESFTAFERHGPRLFETTYHPAGGPPGQTAGVLVVAVDVTAREEGRSRLTFLGTHDALTGLANRTQFDRWARTLLAGAAQARSQVGLLLIDLDDFASVNACRGNAAGDEVLRSVAHALAAALPAPARLARLSGDEFAALLEPGADRDSVAQIGHDLLRALGEIPGHPPAITASIGAVLAQPGTTAELALDRAASALAVARDAGGNTVRIHSTDTVGRDSVRTARRQVQGLLDAPGAVRCVLQPLVDLATGTVVGYEALARFPGHESHRVDEWFALAHDCGLGPALEAEALRVAMTRRPELNQGVYLSVNASAAALTDPAVTASLAGDLTGVVVEITEHDAQLGVDELTAIATLRSRGARIAVDDAGSGYSGLTRLALLAPDLVKLDRLLVAGIDTHPEQAALVSALVEYAEGTGATVCAEGIETLAELRVLADLDVQVGQGWVLGRPSRRPLPPQPNAVAACLDAYRDLLAPPHHLRVTRSANRDGVYGLERAMTHLADAATTADLTRCLSTVADLLHAQRVSLSRVEAEGTVVREVATTGPADPTTYCLADYPSTARVLSDASLAEIRLDDPTADRAECAELASLGLRTLLMVPLRRRDAAVGLLEVYAATSRPWTRTEIARARILGQQLATAMQTLDSISPQALSQPEGRPARKQPRRTEPRGGGGWRGVG